MTSNRRIKASACGLVVALLIAGLFGLRAAIMHNPSIVEGDHTVAAALYAARSKGLDNLMMGLSAFGDGAQRIAITALTCLYLIWRRRWRWALVLVAAMAASGALVPLFKLIFRVARPSVIYSGAETYSFPSGHMTSATVLYLLLAWIASRALQGAGRILPWLVAVMLIGLMGVSRVYVGAHWPSDVVGGLALGAAIAAPALALLTTIKLLNEPVGEPRHDLAILACLLAVAAALGPHAFAKARQTYGPYLEPAPRTSGVVEG